MDILPSIVNLLNALAYTRHSLVWGRRIHGHSSFVCGGSSASVGEEVIAVPGHCRLWALGHCLWVLGHVCGMPWVLVVDCGQWGLFT